MSPQLSRLRAITALAAGAVLLASCVRTAPGGGPSAGPEPHRGLGDVPAADLGFVQHPDAVQWASASDWIPPGDGVRALLPVGDCALGLGTYQNGHRAVTANWTGPATCDRLDLDPAPDGSTRAGDGPPDVSSGWPGGGIGADAAVLERDGSILAADSSGLIRYRPGGQVERLARDDFAEPGFEGQGTRSSIRQLAVTGRGTVVLDAGRSNPGSTAPVLLISRDGGRTLSPVNLPGPAAGMEAQPVIGVLAAAGETIVAIGSGPRRAATWRSTDSGRTWQVSAVEDLPQHLLLTRLVRAGDRWLAFGGVDHESGAQDDTVVLTSTDGLRWDRGVTTGMGVGRIRDVTVTPGGTIVAVASIDDATRPAVDQRPEYCGVVWVGDGGKPWRRGELGCGDSPPQAVTTLRDGRVLIAGNRDLWLRPAAVGAAAGG
ncbi:hypothetical protein [Actinoplanes utahensis]|uniref:Uncharacterized protein n=1 Tax=Actinoplanes utahensis TaxID=1869 RepID=A0A0A6UHP1_ACTUT|nr:hypothetical protein [Actinoplanes utahensis]KHD73819.1 hypothetical protein MB27_32790 [Actinoplanes utahensis]GIF27807.1 hypothetical protein Aut01nite_07930 [Actinoplanes utahensis]